MDKERKEVKEWKKRDKVMLNTKNLVFKERPARKLVIMVSNIFLNLIFLFFDFFFFLWMIKRHMTVIT